MKTLACITLALVGALGFVVPEQPIWKKEFTLNEFNEMNTIYVFKQWAKDFSRSYRTIDEESLR